MRLFVSTDFNGRWNVGTSAVVVANDELEAIALLTPKLPWPEDPFTLREIPLDAPYAEVLGDGDY